MSKAAPATLPFFAGRSHSGKSTQAQRLGMSLNAPVISIDHWVAVIAPPNGGVSGYIEFYPRCQKLIEEMTIELLRKGISMVFDFGGNSKDDRKWVKKVLDASGTEHLCHILETSVETCRSRYIANTGDKMPAEHFEKLMARYDPPGPDDGFKFQKIKP